jgi:hypothetical protein
MKFTFTLSILFFSLLANAQALNSPESIKYDAIHGRYIVSNTSGNNLLSLIPGSAPTLFKSGVTSPYGNTIWGDTVFVCSSGTVKGYNLSTTNLVYNLNLSGSFLNGICTDNSGNMYVSDFSAKKIFRVNIATQQFTTFVTTAGLSNKTPNGLVFDSTNNRIIVATWGANSTILGINLSDSTVSTLKTTTLSNNDGIAIDEDGNVYASFWSNQSIMFFDASFANAPIQVVTGLSNPADIFYNTLSDTLAIPNTNNNTVRFVGFPRPKAIADTSSVCTDSTKTICVAANDVDPVGQGLIVRSISGSQFGSAIINSNCVDYTANSQGEDTLTYTVCTNDTPSFCRTAKLILTNEVCSFPTNLSEVIFANQVVFTNSGQLNIFWNSGKDEQVDVAIFDLSGRQISSATYHQETGLNSLVMDISGTQSGIYLLQMRSSSSSTTEKFLVR